MQGRCPGATPHYPPQQSKCANHRDQTCHQWMAGQDGVHAQAVDAIGERQVGHGAFPKGPQPGRGLTVQAIWWLWRCLPLSVMADCKQMLAWSNWRHHALPLPAVGTTL